MGIFPAKAAGTRIGIRSAPPPIAIAQPMTAVVPGANTGCMDAGPAAIDLHLRALFLCLPVERLHTQEKSQE